MPGQGTGSCRLVPVLGRQRDRRVGMTVASYFSLARAAWVPCVVSWDHGPGDLRRAGGRGDSRANRGRRLAEAMRTPTPSTSRPPRPSGSRSRRRCCCGRMRSFSDPPSPRLAAPVALAPARVPRQARPREHLHVADVSDGPADLARRIRGAAPGPPVSQMWARRADLSLPSRASQDARLAPLRAGGVRHRIAHSDHETRATRRALGERAGGLTRRRRGESSPAHAGTASGAPRRSGSSVRAPRHERRGPPRTEAVSL